MKCRLALIALAAAMGCSEEWGPEPIRTTTVRGRITRGTRPVGSGWVEIAPVDGTRGRLRIGPLRPDGSFEIESVGIGRVLIGLVRAPVGPLATPGGLIEDGAAYFHSFSSPIRRVIRPDDAVPLVIDLDREVAGNQEDGRASTPESTERP